MSLISHPRYRILRALYVSVIALLSMAATSSVRAQSPHRAGQQKIKTLVVPGNNAVLEIADPDDWLASLDSIAWYDADLDRLWVTVKTTDGQSELGYLKLNTSCGTFGCYSFTDVSSGVPYGPLYAQAALQLDNQHNQLFSWSYNGLISIDLSTGAITGPIFPITPNNNPNDIAFDDEEGQFISSNNNTGEAMSTNASTGNITSFGEGAELGFENEFYYGVPTLVGTDKKHMQKEDFVAIPLVKACEANQQQYFSAISAFNEQSATWITPICLQSIISNVDLNYGIFGYIGPYNKKAGVVYTEVSYTPQGSKNGVEQIFAIDVNNPSGPATFVADISAYGFTGYYSAQESQNNFLASLNSQNEVMLADVSANRSWYVDCVGNEQDGTIYQWMFDAGYALGQRDANTPLQNAQGQPNYSSAILDFGAMTSDGGATCWGRHLKAAAIETAAFRFANGWVSGSMVGTNVPYLRLVVGTSNSNNGSLNWNSAGQNWRTIVTAVANSLSAPQFQTISVTGGIDIEPGKGYSPPNDVEAWEQGYGIAFVDFGALLCPSKGTYTPNTPCGSTKTYKSPWNVGYFASVIGKNAIDPNNVIMPEIYSDTHATEWNLFAKFVGSGNLTVLAPLTEYAACFPMPASPSCAGQMNTPYQAERALSQFFSGLSTSLDIEHRAY